MDRVALSKNHQPVGRGHPFLSPASWDFQARISKRLFDVRGSKDVTGDLEKKSRNSARSDRDRLGLRIIRGNGPLLQSRVRRGTRATFRLASTARGLCKVTASQVPRIPDVVTREALGEYIEHLFNEVRGEVLLIAALAYGLEVSLDELRVLQIRDIRLSEGVVIFGGGECTIPKALLEDMQEQMRWHCRSGECNPPRSSMDNLFFSSEAFSRIEEILSGLERCYRSLFEGFRARNGERCLNIRLKVLGWFHKRWASRVAGVNYQSAIELFDKGPRINRRRSGGVRDMYYVWRLSRVVSW